jgi:hypothetical protein
MRRPFCIGVMAWAPQILSYGLCRRSPLGGVFAPAFHGPWGGNLTLAEGMPGRTELVQDRLTPRFMRILRALGLCSEVVWPVPQSL